MNSKNVKRDDEFQKKVQESIVVPKFYNKIWKNPIIESDLKNNELANLLDLAGIDKIIRYNGGQLSGLAQRIQRKCFADWHTLTIRDLRRHANGKVYPSEYFKLDSAIKKHNITATYQSHCYANADTWEGTTDLIDAIVVNRIELINWMKNNPDKIFYKVAVDEPKIFGEYQVFICIKFDAIPDEFIIDRYNKSNKNKNKTLNGYTEVF